MTRSMLTIVLLAAACASMSFAQTPPVADAGDDQLIWDIENSGPRFIFLNGTASHATGGATIVSAAWTDDDGVVVADTLGAAVELDRGFHTFTLTVTDSNGLTDADACVVSISGQQLLNLPNDRDAFPAAADIVWPQNVGEPHICLWYGDKFAAMSITIDDNFKGDWPWWLNMAATYEFTPTWFIIVSRVESGSNPGHDGTWPDYVDLDAAGGDVQSHTMNHHSDDDVRPDAEVRYEYEQSQALIDANVPGHRCLTLGYPHGKGKPEIARDYFIAARGVFGTPNKPGKINWMMTNSASGRIDSDFIDAILYGTSGVSWLNSSEWKRAWLCVHFHGVSDKANQQSHMEYIQARRDLIWWGSFGDVARFGQERDSAEIAIVENGPDRIAFTVSDRMNDLIFDHPLTIKVRIPNAWAGRAKATQDGKPVAMTAAEHSGADYVLVDAVPDRGVVEILPNPNADIDGDGDVDLNDFVILKNHFGSTAATGSQGDLDGDGDVDLADFVILKNGFGS